MDILLLFLGFLFVVLGILGSFLPVIPGPPLSWLGLLLLYLTDGIENDWWFLGITLVVAIAVLVLDYAIPAIGTKKFGGSKGGVIGSIIGLIVAVAFPIIGIFGIVIWPFIGALTGEIIAGTKKNKAFKAAIALSLFQYSQSRRRFQSVYVYKTKINCGVVDMGLCSAIDHAWRLYGGS